MALGISAVVDEIREIFHSGDPELRSWFLVRHDFMPMILCLTYVAFAKWIGPAWMKNRKPYNLRTPMILYNSFLVFTYVYCIGRVFYLLSYLNNNSKLCTPSRITKEDTSYDLISYAHIIYMLKYVEFLDTIFFILRKKDHLISNLHVVHHAILPLAAWTLLRTENSGFQAFPGLINSCIHIVMYSYYALAAIGPSVRKFLWWKRYLTMLQMAQFIVIISLQVILMPLLGCSAGKTSFYMTCILAILFFVMFANFYIRTFLLKKAAHQKKEK